MTPARQPQQEYIITEAWVEAIYVAIKDMGYPQTAKSTASMLRSRPHTSPPAPAIMELRSCFGEYEDCPCDDECIVSKYCEKCGEDHKNNCGLTDSRCYEVQADHDAAIRAEAAKAEREKVLDDMERNLRNRMVWSGDKIVLYSSDLDGEFFLMRESLRAQREKR